MLFCHLLPTVVPWLSPFDALLDINFRFEDRNANRSFGDGVDWSVERGSGAAPLGTGLVLACARRQRAAKHN